MINGMVDVISNRCEEPGCRKQPNYGYEGSKAVRCKEHIVNGMTDVKGKMCDVEGCKKHAAYGDTWQKPIRCKKHSDNGMENVVSKRCEAEGCITRPNFGYEFQKPIFCQKHRSDDMVDVTHKRCESCDRLVVWFRCPKDKPQLCFGCFEIKFPDFPQLRRFKTKENFFRHKILKAIPGITIRGDKVIPNGCKLLQRPDYYIGGIYRDLIGECDEDGHNRQYHYKTPCEEARPHNFLEANGYRPIHVFRFNPDSKPLPVTINQNTGIASEGPGFKVLMDKMVTFIREWLEWDANNPVDSDEQLMQVTYL